MIQQATKATVPAVGVVTDSSATTSTNNNNNTIATASAVQPGLETIDRYELIMKYFFKVSNKERAIPSHVWMSICENQKLSEQFILEFFHRMDFKKIFKYQKLSYTFIKKYYQSGNLSDILINQNVDEKFIDDIYRNTLKSYIYWDIV